MKCCIGSGIVLLSTLGFNLADTNLQMRPSLNNVAQQANALFEEIKKVKQIQEVESNQGKRKDENTNKISGKVFDELERDRKVQMIDQNDSILDILKISSFGNGNLRVFKSESPSINPTSIPSNQPSNSPSMIPSVDPSVSPSLLPSFTPSQDPSSQPSLKPSSLPTFTSKPSSIPSIYPSLKPSITPSLTPSYSPSFIPSKNPSLSPSITPSLTPTSIPSISIKPSQNPSSQPSLQPTFVPSIKPSDTPSSIPSSQPSLHSSTYPTVIPSSFPSSKPSAIPTNMPSSLPSGLPSKTPSVSPSLIPSDSPSKFPTLSPSQSPSGQPSLGPTVTPSFLPSTTPSERPSLSMNPSVQPSQSSLPTLTPSEISSSSPSVSQVPTIDAELTLKSELVFIAMSNFPNSNLSSSLIDIYENKIRGKVTEYYDTFYNHTMTSVVGVKVKSQEPFEGNQSNRRLHLKREISPKGRALLSKKQSFGSKRVLQESNGNIILISTEISVLTRLLTSDIVSKVIIEALSSADFVVSLRSSDSLLENIDIQVNNNEELMRSTLIDSIEGKSLDNERLTESKGFSFGTMMGIIGFLVVVIMLLAYKGYVEFKRRRARALREYYMIDL